MSSIRMELTGKERILERISPYMPMSVMEQLKKKQNISAIDSIRLLSILPQEAWNKFPNMSEETLVFPRDHNRHYFLAEESYTIGLNLKSVDEEDSESAETPGKRIAVSANISCHTVDTQDPSLFALQKSNQLFRSSFSLTMGATDHSDCEHWYIRDKGGYVGDYRPSVHDELPVVSFGHDANEKQEQDEDEEEEKPLQKIQGLLPFDDEESENKQMRWFMYDEASGAQIDVILTLPFENEILLEGREKTGTFKDVDLGLNYMKYCFPYLRVKGFVSFPETADEFSRHFKVVGVGYLTHKGGVEKERKGIVKHLDEWKNLLKLPQHRNAWIKTTLQFPSKQLFITGCVKDMHPMHIKKEAQFSWAGTVTTRGGVTKFYEDGILIVKGIFQSPSYKSIKYTTSIEIYVGNQVFSLEAICPDQRQFLANQGESYNAACNAQILSDTQTIKTKGVGFLENIGFTTHRNLEEYQLDEIGVAPLVGNFASILNEKGSIKSNVPIGPVIVLLIAATVIAVCLFKFFRKKKKQIDDSVQFKSIEELDTAEIN